MAIILNRTVPLDVPISFESLHGVVFSNENKGHKFVISCMRGGELLTLTGTVTARFMRANNTTILIAGNDYTGIVDGKAVVTLPQDCYNVPGRFQMAVFLTADGVTSCIYACVGSVQRTQNGELIDSGEAVPSLEELLAQIDACEQATADAQEAASHAVRYTDTQTLTDDQKSVARNNISAASENDVADLKSALEDVIPLLSDDATLLSDTLTDKTYTGTGMSYTLTGNVIEMSGTATGQSAFTALGSTTAVPPQWMLGGETYVFKLTNNTPALVRFQAKTTTQTSIGTFAQFEQSGTYLLTIPEDITAFRLLIIVAQGVTANGTMTLEISHPIYSKDIFDAVYELPTTITALSAVSKSGYYLIKTANLSTYTDLPEGAEIAANGALLFVNYVSGTEKTQILDKRDHGLRWIRTISDSTIGDWKVQDVVRLLKRFGNGNANDIPYLGCYAWGSEDTVLNVMPNANAGAIIHIPRDASTKYQIGLHYKDTGVYVRGYKSGTWRDWSRLAYLSDIPTQSAPLKPIIRYLQGSLDSGNATERIEVYLPCGDHYIAYFLYHYVVQDINCNCWRIMSFWRYDSSLNESTRVRLNANGELECAIRMKNRDDFSGGFAHGDEIMTGWNVFLDGEDITNSLSDYTSATPFNEFRLVRQSNMYDPADSTTLIAVHGCEYVFDGSLTLKINQSLKWAIAAELANCYMAMFTPLKTYTDHAYTDTEFTPIALPATHYSIIKPKAKKIVIYGENTGFLAEFSVEKYPSLATGDTARFTDNDGLAYNKCYFHVSAGGTTTVDELWQSTTVYKVIA